MMRMVALFSILTGLLLPLVAVDTSLELPNPSDFFPQWSPDGRHIVFESQRDGNSEIYTVNADGSTPVRLTHSPGRDAHPSYSHDGRFIVFQSPRSNETDTNVYRMRADGTSVVQLTNANGFSGVPVYSPDDNWIAFLVRETPASKWRI